MIFIEPNEKLSGLYDSIEYKVCPHLEEWTGADLMVSTKSFPVTTESLVLLHVKSGALLVQRKSGMDLISSFGFRLNSSLERMRLTGAQQVQCVLLFIGSITENLEGKCVVDGFKTDYTLPNVLGTIEGWVERGGVYSIIEKGNLGRWLAIKEHHLKVYEENRTKYIYPDAPFQELKSVKDWRITIATLPMMGTVRTQALYDFIEQKGYDSNLLNALAVLTDGRPEFKVKGIGEEVIKHARNWMGLPENFGIGIEWKGEPDNGE